MKKLWFKQLGPRSCIRLCGVAGLLVFLTACQPGTETKADHRAMHNGILGEKVDLGVRADICRHKVRVNRKHCGRLSRRARKRLLYDYVTGIRQKITVNWLKPDGLADNESCSVLIKQRIDGCVRHVSFRNCRHYKMRTSIRRAVLKASPLPVAPHPALFTDQILLVFKVKRHR